MIKKLIQKYPFETGFAALAMLSRLPSLSNFNFANFPEFYRDYYMAENILLGHIPLLGPPSMQAHFNFGPVYYYILSPFLFIFGGHPSALIFAGFLLYTLSAIVFYKLLKLWLHDGYSAKVGTLFYAIAIYGIHLTSYISNPNFLPLFVLLYFYYLSKIVQLEESGYKNYFILGLVFGIAAQLHVTAAILLLASVWPVAKIFKHQNFTSTLKKIGVGLLGVIFISAPYVWFELTHKFQNLLSLLGFGQNHLTGGGTANGLEAVLNFFSAAINPFELKNSYSYLEPNFLYAFVAVAAAALAMIVIFAAIKNKSPISKNKIFSTTAQKILLGWFGFGLLLTLLFNRGLHDHYLIILWPLPAILIAAAAQWLKNWLNVTYPFVIFIALISALQLYSFYHKPTLSWQEFFGIYPVRYQNNPNTADIGFSPVQW